MDFGGEEFAESIVESLIKKHGTPQFVWSHERCTNRLNPDTLEMVPIKNFDKVKKKGFSLDRTIMVDDTPEKLLKHYGNLVRVREYLEQEKDLELKILMEYLSVLKSAPNIRKVEKRGWQRKYNA